GLSSYVASPTFVSMSRTATNRSPLPGVSNGPLPVASGTTWPTLTASRIFGGPASPSVPVRVTASPTDAAWTWTDGGMSVGWGFLAVCAELPQPASDIAIPAARTSLRTYVAPL